MTDYTDFLEISTGVIATHVERDHVMDMGIHPLWPDMPRIIGPAYPVRCPAGDNLMVHAAFERAPAGSILVVEAGDTDYAISGGNGYTICQRHGILGFVVDGVLREPADARKIGFPIYARGVIPMPANKTAVGKLNVPVTCGGVLVAPGDIVVADDGGIVVVPVEQSETILKEALAHAQEEGALKESPLEREEIHRIKHEKLLAAGGFKD